MCSDSIPLSPYHSVACPLLHPTTILCTPSFAQAQVLCSSGPLSPVMQISTASLRHYPPFGSTANQSVLVKTLSISSSRRPSPSMSCKTFKTFVKALSSQLCLNIIYIQVPLEYTMQQDVVNYLL
ncbi:hypothetical protein B0H14DRAFT_3436289 [Mycena olivaceomarginata]|nr:hypothetical protein B0H14DRAFT_3436289 [Mycena olivaceomarginata]